jgi:hypothetical protein
MIFPKTECLFQKPQKPPYVGRNQDVMNSIIITWQIPYSRIRQMRSSTAGLLLLMSSFHRQCVPESLLRSRSEARNAVQYHASKAAVVRISVKEMSSSQPSTSYEFEFSVQALRNYFSYQSTR